MKEKTTLILLFALVFALSSALMYLMIKKDIVSEEKVKQVFQRKSENVQDENIWPRVEIQTRTN
jgi:hypothetical protein